MQLRFFQELEDAKTVLIAGAGGGYDIFAGLPLYHTLTEAGKTVHLANLSFSTIYASTGRRMGPALVEINARTEAHLRYFPELHLTRWFERRGEDVPIYCLDHLGAYPIAKGYEMLADCLKPDAIILVDGGTDSLMRGDEAGLGTPEEDAASLAAVAALSVPKKLLACIGFGIDTYHGVCHADFLEAVAALTKSNHFHGAWSVTPEMPAAQFYREASEFVFEQMPYHASIVNTSVLSAVAGEFGDYHAIPRTEGSKLFINPLMSLYWTFDLDAVAARNLYLDSIRATQTFAELRDAIIEFRYLVGEHKPWKTLPM